MAGRAVSSMREDADVLCLSSDPLPPTPFSNRGYISGSLTVFCHSLQLLSLHCFKIGLGCPYSASGGVPCGAGTYNYSFYYLFRHTKSD